MNLISHDSIDLSQLFDEKIWLPELGSDTLKVFENKIKPLGLDLGDFRCGEHLSEPIMLDLIRSGAGIGIGLCNHKDHGSKHFKLVRINEFSTPYAIYAHCQIQSSAVIQALFKSIEQSRLELEGQDSPVIERSNIHLIRSESTDDTKAIRVGIQSRTIQPLSLDARSKTWLIRIVSKRTQSEITKDYSVAFKDYHSAAPILTELKSGNLDIAIAGDYAITHIANSLTAEDEKLYSSASRALTHGQRITPDDSPGHRIT